MRVRRLKKAPQALEISAFLNLIVVLVPFLLSTAVFTRLAVLDMSLPAQSSGAAEQLKVDHLQLEVVIRPEAIEVGDRIGGLIQRIPNTEAGQPDLVTLNELVKQIKLKFPDQRDASVLAEPATVYDRLVQVMDAVRGAHAKQGREIVRTELFPDISIGDAPVRHP
jgi:biopolymer transport protein ExbD